MFARGYKYIRWLSLDVTAGAIFLCLFFGDVFQVHIVWKEWLALGLTVWCIYTFDHLHDAIRSNLVNEMRLFHQRNFKVVSILLIVAGLFNGWLVGQLDGVVLRGGLLLLGFVLIYFVLTRFEWGNYFKEFMIAMIFSVGVILVSLVREEFLEIQHGVGLVAMVVVAFLNVCLFAYFEKEFDQKEGFNSIALRMEDTVFRRLLIGVFFVLLLAVLLLVFIGHYRLFGYFLFVFLMYLLIWIFRDWFSKNERYRMLGDGVFLSVWMF
jgi:4-hydroxybenzoate polyprenyltransferase